jgi:glycosidase
MLKISSKSGELALDDNLVFYEFHISRECRKKYNIDNSLFSIRGNVVVADFRTARYVSQKINEIRIREGKTGSMVTAGQLNGLGLLHEILHFLIRYYEETENPGIMKRALEFLFSNNRAEDVDHTLLQFIKDFPPTVVYNEEISAEDYLTGQTGLKPNREIIIEEIYLLRIENLNPATSSLEELYSDKSLSSASIYHKIIEQSESFFRNEKPMGSENLSLFEFLRRPIIISPYSLEDQLNFIRNNWSFYIFELFNERLLSGRDLIQEDLRLFYNPAGFEKPTPPVPAYEFDNEYFDRLRRKLQAGEELDSVESRFYYSEYEKFTHDVEWMPRVVMIAKNVYVWLNQLSSKYQREIRSLDQIPDEELNLIAEWNFTALWLIGIWERSSASKKIKQIMGNPEAAASAYSLFDYVIAADIGGEDAFQNLKYRAALKGIRLASDMVPNHTGIYSKWVIEKPDYFLQTPYPPYPSYAFSGPNLSADSRVEVRIEDKYYNHTDAAVVFQRKDTHTGDIKYIYHGNDGTHMPWNDTAQLNLLNPEVRESLIQTIMHVARKTPIIRFDAAMTLAKKHFQRLWFPQPGTGGAIPSRSDFAMTRDQLDQAIPQEFWREVVDRINSEMPDTLLLAEAFWLMEGYFVRTLGMHRVYNSAFMHMMMKEENEKYRLLIKNTLEFNAEILKRYVNFMSNPDEETAVNQFGKGDKYFGITIMMITLPGLPMFAHGQIEGYSEKYGMEYTRAYYNEYPDHYLIDRHKDEIFPLLKKRYLFSQVNNFQFYDFIDNSGNINENVFAFSNSEGDEKSFVVYNNSYIETRGTINHSFSKPYPGAGYNSVKLSAALNLKNDNATYYKVYEQRTRLQYLLSGRDIEESGLYIPLNGYEYRVYLEFEEIYDERGDFEKLYRYLDGRGVFSLQETLNEINLAPLHYALYDLFNEESYNGFRNFLRKSETSEIPEILKNKLHNTLQEILNSGKMIFDKEVLYSGINKDMSRLRKKIPAKKSGKTDAKKKEKDNESLLNDDKTLAVMLPQLILYRIFVDSNTGIEKGYDLFDKLLLNRVIFSSLSRFMSPEDAGKNVHVIKITSSVRSEELKRMFAGSSSRSKKSLKLFLSTMFSDNEIGSFLNLNEFKKKKYFNKERFEYLLDWFYLLNFVYEEDDVKAGSKQKEAKDSRASGAIKKLKLVSAEEGYSVDDILKVFDVKEKKKDVGQIKTATKRKKTK